MRAVAAEIAPDLFRISLYLRSHDLEFNHFLVRDEEPLLYHAGMRGMFPELLAAVRRILDPAAIRWIGFSHFEADECGALNRWLEIAPRSEPLCGEVAAMMNAGDFADRPARALRDGERLETGRYRFTWHATPHLPHGWDAGMLFEERQRTLFCSDLFQHSGAREASTWADVVRRTRETLSRAPRGPFRGSSPFTARTEGMFERLAGLRPKTLAIMHGSSYVGDGARALRDLCALFRELHGQDAVHCGDAIRPPGA